MSMAKNVIVTVRYRHFARDMELPAQLCLSDLCGKLLAALKNADDSLFRDITRLLLLHDGRWLADGAATLADYGIQTGDFLDIAREV